jgi:hypothetical protein
MKLEHASSIKGIELMGLADYDAPPRGVVVK